MIFQKLALDAVNRAAEVTEYASGKSPNVARVLRTLGAEAVVAGFIGGDRGRFLEADLVAAGIGCQFVTVEPQTRLCTTVIDRAAGTATELVEESAPIDAAGWEQMDRRLRTLLPKSQTWVFSGSLPPSAPQDFYARWIPLALEQQATLILDARGEPLRLALKHHGFIVKLNREELAETLGQPLDSADDLRTAALRIAPRGGGSIVTLGGAGSIASDGTNVWRVTPPKIKAVSAVGSGDAFAAGLALEISRGKNLGDALALAAACGAANALTALAGHLSKEDVERLVKDVRIEAA